MTVFTEAWREHRAYLVGLAFRMLGDIGDAQDVVQEAFARLSRTGDGEVLEVRGWLTVVTSRLCLDQIRSARARHEFVHDVAAEDGVLPVPAGADPADRVTLDDDVHTALLVVLERLTPAERVAFVLHDVFRAPFDDIADTLGRPVATCRQLARRARQKIADIPLRPHQVEDTEHRLVTERFIQACTNGDLDALLTVLHPQAWGRADFGPGSSIQPVTNHGAPDVARNLVRFWGHPATTMVPHPLCGGDVVLVYVARALVAVIDLTIDGDLVTSVRLTTSAGP